MREKMSILFVFLALTFAAPAILAHGEEECGKDPCLKTCELKQCSKGDALCQLQNMICEQERDYCHLSNITRARHNQMLETIRNLL
jgi:hypothetical protein